MIVVDSSALIEALAGSDPPAALLSSLAAEQLHVPHLLDYEFRNAQRGPVIGKKVTAARAAGALLVKHDLPLRRYPDEFTGECAWALRDNFNGYDATYVALAEALDAPLVTTDDKIARTARTVEVRIPR